MELCHAKFQISFLDSEYSFMTFVLPLYSVSIASFPCRLSPKKGESLGMVHTFRTASDKSCEEAWE